MQLSLEHVRQLPQTHHRSRPAGLQTEADAGNGAAGKTAPDAPSGDKTVMDEEQFLRELAETSEGRAEAAARYTGAETAAMTNQEIADMNHECCETERDLYEKYKDAAFGDRNLQYLCELYMKGLKNQFDAYDSWQSDGDIAAYNELWDAGYNKRALALVEIADTYQLDIPDLDEMRSAAEDLNEKGEEEAVTELSSEDILKAQNDLNTLGFRNEADGNYGARTAQLLHRFQVMYGYEPADGVLDQESLAQLEAEASKVLPKETESESETKD